MPTTLVTGPANAAKAGRVLDGFRRLAEQGAAPFLIVPTAADRDNYSRELLAGGALIGGRVLTWEDLVGLLARRLGVDGRLIGPLRRRTLVRRAISRSRGDLSSLEASADTTGFTAALESLFRELGRAAIDSDRLESMDSGLDDERREGIRILLSAYETVLADEGVLDRERQALAVLSLLEDTQSLEWEQSPILAYGFSELTVVQRRVFEALARSCDVTISLPADGRTKVGLAEHTVLAFERHGKDEVTVEVLPPQRDAVGPGLLEKHLFADSQRGAAIGAREAVRVLVGSGTDAMAQLVAVEVESRIAAGVAPEEIAIIVPPGLAPTPIADALRDAGRDASWQRKTEFGRTALGQALVGLLRCALTPESATADDAVAFIAAVGDGEQRDIAEQIDCAMRRNGDRRASAFRERWIERTKGPLPMLERIPHDPGASVLAGAAKSAARDILARLLGSAGSRLRVDEVEQAAALSAVTVGMNDVALLLETDDAEAMVDELAAIPIELSGPVARPGAVLISDALSIRARSFHTVIACGLEDGLFPASFVPDPFIEDAAAEGLELGDERLSGVEVHARAEREQFTICAARARESLVLVRRRTDDAGEEVARSPFLDEAMRLLDLPFDHCEPGGDWSAGRLEGSPGSRTALRLSAAATGGSVPPAIAGSLGRAASEAIAEDLLAVASPTRLETYTQCPAKWLAENVLSPADFAEKPEPMELGTLVHRGLEAAVRELIEADLGPLDAANRPRVEEAVEAEFERAARTAGNSVAVRLRFANARRIVGEWLDLEVERADGWCPVRVEMSFSDRDGACDPLDLGDGLTVSGTVDRVDVATLPDGSERIVIRDYKTGRSVDPGKGSKSGRVSATNSANRTAGRWADEHRPVFQAPLYLLAASRELGIEPGGAFYETLRDGERRGGVESGIVDSPAGFSDVVEPGRLDVLIAELVERAKAEISRMKAGDVQPDPDCDCPHPWLCGRRV